MIAVYLIPVYLLLNGYMLWRVMKWLGLCSGFFRKLPVRIVCGVVYAFAALSIGVAFVLPMSGFRRLLKILGTYWLGIMIYLFMGVVIVDIILMVYRLVKKRSSTKLHIVLGAVMMVAVIATCIYGSINGAYIRTTPYDITVGKKTSKLDSVKIVLVSDIHMGYNIGVSRVQGMVDRINEQDADLVLIAGDIFNNEYEALEDPDKLAEVLRGIKSKYGVYATYGNHDIEEPILAGFTFGGSGNKESNPLMDELLEKANITLLRDEAVLIADSFYVYGRPDEERPGRGITVRKTGEEIMQQLGTDKPVIVLDHEPKELQELADAGVDVFLNGHTHDGQLFPMNITSHLVWENSCGYLKKGNMHNIVTSGAGLFGPNMRVGTKAEICSITVHFE
jgi:hypothetical protein